MEERMRDFAKKWWGGRNRMDKQTDGWTIGDWNDEVAC